MRYLSFLVGLYAAFATPLLAQTPAATRPAADFARLPFMSDPALSPDGARFAAKIAIQGKQALAIVSLFEPEKPPVLIALGENDLNDWTWVNDNWLVVSIGAVSNFENQPFYVSRAAGVSADGRTIKPIAFGTGGQSAHVLWAARDGSPRILMSLQKSIYSGSDFWPVVNEVDVSKGRPRQVVAGSSGVMRWAADATGTVRLAVGYNDVSRTARLLYRPDGRTTFRIVDRADRRRDEELTVPALFTADPGKALTFDNRDGRDALYELDLGTLTVGKRVFAIDGHDIDSIIPDAAGTGVAGIRFTTDRARVSWTEPALAEIQAQLDAAVGDRIATIVSLSRDQKRLIVHVGRASQPGAYYFYDAGQGGAMKRFAYVNAPLKDAALGPVSSFRYKARDGLEIPAVLTLPAGRPAKNLPLIVMPHGGPQARDAEQYDWWAQFLADRGYAVVQPNYRGSTGYGTAFEDAGEGQWGLKMQDDLDDSINHLASKGVIDAKRVCIMGASYGGYAALRGAQRDGALYRCAISYAGVSDLSAMMRYDGKFLNGRTHRDGWKESAPDLRAVSPVNYAATFNAPVLIMHGKTDLRVPVAQSREMAERLKAAGKPVRYIEQREGDHHFSREADRLQFLEEVEAFLKAHNPA